MRLDIELSVNLRLKEMLMRRTKIPRGRIGGRGDVVPKCYASVRQGPVLTPLPHKGVSQRAGRRRLSRAHGTCRNHIETSVTFVRQAANTTRDTVSSSAKCNDLIFRSPLHLPRSGELPRSPSYVNFISHSQERG